MRPEEARRRLGVAPGAGPAELRGAYRAALLRDHPDRGGTAEAVAAVIEAHQVLLHDQRRARSPVVFVRRRPWWSVWVRGRSRIRARDRRSADARRVR